MTDASGSVSLAGASSDSAPARLDRYQEYRIICRCAGGATFTLSGSLVAGRSAVLDTKTGAAVYFSGTDGGFVEAALAWSGNSANDPVYIDVSVGAPLVLGRQA